MEKILSVLENIKGYLPLIRLADLLDVAIVAYLVYKLLSLVKSTRAANILKGVAIFLAALWLSSKLNLRVVNYILSHMVEWGVLALIIVFQPEIRRILEQLGSKNIRLLRTLAPEKELPELERAIDQTVLACTEMSRTRTGVLIVFERKILLDDVVRSGTTLDASVSSELLKNIFFVKAPMHDGAVIIRNGRILGAGCMLPLSKNVNLSRDLGMRHRAGIGMSENSDAVVVIVSEETGSISVAIGGMLKRHLQAETLSQLLHNELMPQQEEPDKVRFPLRELLRTWRKGSRTMKKNDASRKVLRIIGSILVAIALWIYVDTVTSPEVTLKVKNVPVEFSGEDTTLADRGLMLLSGYDTTVDLVIKGPRNELRKLDRSKIRIVANTSNIRRPAARPDLRGGVPGQHPQRKLTVDSASIYSITVTVGELDSKEVPIQCEIVGSVADGFMAGELTLDPEVLLLRGQRDDLLNVSYAKVRLDITGADKTVVQALEFELYDHNDVKIENSAIRSSEKLIGATMPVWTVKEVPLRVNFVEDVGATMETVDYTISPATVKLVGEKARLDEIDSIVLDTLYVQDLEDSQSLTYTIPVPEDVTIADGVDTATVTVVVRGVTERTLTVSRFTFENVPEGMTATAETESLNVRLRGLTAEVNALTAENVHIVADLSGLTGAGVHTVPVTIRIEGYENIGIKGSYQMVVDLSVTPDEPGQP